MASTHARRSPTQHTKQCVAAVSAVYLSPATLSAQNHSTSELLRTLSRMAASKPTSHPFPLSTRLGALAGDPGCFPLDHEAYPPRSHCRATPTNGIRSLADLGNPVRPLSHPVALPPPGEHATLHQNAFRGEPAITESDWPFTPTHSSSPRFSTQAGTVLHALLHAPQPGHG